MWWVPGRHWEDGTGEESAGATLHRAAQAAAQVTTQESTFPYQYNPVLRIRIRRIHMFLGLPDPLVRDTNPDPSIIKQK